MSCFSDGSLELGFAHVHVRPHCSFQVELPTPLSLSYMNKKHCQRHNGPEGWVLLTKVTSLGHITSSYTNLDQTSSESRPSTNFKISTKHQHLNKTYKSWPNLASESRGLYYFQKLSFLTKVISLGNITSSYTNLDQISSSEYRLKHQLQNINQTSVSQLNLNFKILIKPSVRISTKIQLHNLNQT